MAGLIAFIDLLEFELAKATTGPAVRLSVPYLNWALRQSNGRRTDGSFFADPLRGVQKHGICEQASMPHFAPAHDADHSPSANAQAEADRRKVVFPLWIKQRDVKTGLTADQLAVIRQSLADGHPVAACLRWPKTEQYAPDNVLLTPPPKEVFDGHSVVLVGYDDDPAQPGGGTFTFRNCAGAQWRDGGYARISYVYAQSYANEVLALPLGDAPPNKWRRTVTSLPE